MTRGPRPLPDNVRSITGARPRLRAADLADGVHPEVGAPPPPKHLSREAAAEWRRVTPILVELRLLTKLDRSGIERYCRIYGRWQQVERALSAEQARLRAEGKSEADALMYQTDTGYQRESMLSRLARDLAHQVEQAEACFGMNPSARARVVASRNDAQASLPGMEAGSPTEQARGFAAL